MIDTDREQMNIRLPKPLKDAAKMWALRKDETLTSFVIEAMEWRIGRLKADEIAGGES